MQPSPKAKPRGTQPGRRPLARWLAGTAIVLALAGLAALIWSVAGKASSAPAAEPVEQVTKPALGS